MKKRYRFKYWWISKCSSIRKQIESAAQTIQFLSSIAASIATVFAAIFAVYTLNEMKAERDAAYKPYVLIEDVELLSGMMEYDDEQMENVEEKLMDVFGEKNDIVTPQERTFIEEQAWSLSFKNEINTPELLILKLMNIGVGTAKNISVFIKEDDANEWLIAMKNLLNKYDFQYDYDIRFDGIIEQTGENESWWDHSDYSFGKNEKISFIKTNTDYKLNTRLFFSFQKVFIWLLKTNDKLPQEYQFTNNLFYNEFLHENFPSLLIQVSYEDIQGKVYEQLYQINFCFQREEKRDKRISQYDYSIQLKFIPET